MDTVHPVIGNVRTLRRSQRLRIGEEVVVVALRGNGKSSTERTKTLIVSANGALIPLRMVVAVGQELMVRNMQTQKEIACRVVDLETSDESDIPEVGIEFVAPSPRFWSVCFPSEAWTSRGAEAKGYVPRIASPPDATKKQL